MGDGEAVQILLTTPQLSMESIEEQNVGRGYRRGGATVETVDQYDEDYYSEPVQSEEVTYFNHGNAKTFGTLSESFTNNRASHTTENQYLLQNVFIAWALLLFVLRIIIV